MNNQTENVQSIKTKKVIRHAVFIKTGEHRQWRVENYGTDEEKEVEIFKGDPDWEG